MPKRIQLRCTEGWRKPENAVIVSRPSKWGNPYSEMQIGAAFPSLTSEQVHSMAVNQFRDLVRADRPITLNERKVGGRGERERVTYSYPKCTEILTELAGKDLCCWCDLDEPCHADVLLRIANGGE